MTTDDATPLPCHKCGKPPTRGETHWVCDNCFDGDYVGDPPGFVTDSITAMTIVGWNERTREAMADRDDRIVAKGIAKMKGTP